MPGFRRLPKMQKILLAVVSVIALGVGGYMLYAQNNLAQTPEGVACTMEAKLCPDGVTYVGRQGPNCAFSACPTPTSTSTPANNGPVTVNLKFGERKEVLGIFITPISIVEDSRCPTDVQCIWAGTVKVKLKVESSMGTGDLTLELGALGTTETEEIILTAVSPTRVTTQPLTPSDYTLTFTVQKRI